MRTVRKDGTVRWKGDFLEVRPELVGDRIELRFDASDPTARPRVFRDRKFVCDTVPLDRLANMHRLRRRIAGEPEPTVEKTGFDPLGLIEDEHYRRTRIVGDPQRHRAADDHDDHDEET
jgi:hypothetical protein